MTPFAVCMWLCVCVSKFAPKRPRKSVLCLSSFHSRVTAATTEAWQDCREIKKVMWLIMWPPFHISTICLMSWYSVCVCFLCVSLHRVIVTLFIFFSYNKHALTSPHTSLACLLKQVKGFLTFREFVVSLLLFRCFTSWQHYFSLEQLQHLKSRVEGGLMHKNGGLKRARRGQIPPYSCNVCVCGYTLFQAQFWVSSS